MTTKDEKALREQICKVGRELYRFRLVDNHAGNISARLDDERILITPSGVSKGFMEPDQLIVIDRSGSHINARDDGLKASTETPMHLAAYDQRDDIGSIVHAHPAHAVALTIAGIDLNQARIPEAIMILGQIPTLPYATPSSNEDRDIIGEAIAKHDAVMLSHHGSLTVGRDPWQAYMRLETLEHVAHVTMLVRQLGGGTSINEEKMRRLLDLRQDFGLARPGEDLSDLLG